MAISPAEFLAMQTRLNKGKGEPVPDDAVEHESELHDEILAFCRNKLWAVVHSRMDQKSTCTVGTADFIVFADGGRTFIIECKSRSGKLKPAQLAFKVQAEMNGHQVFEVRSMSEFLKIVT